MSKHARADQPRPPADGARGAQNAALAQPDPDDVLRTLPAVDTLIRAAPIQQWARAHDTPHEALVRAAREVLAAARDEIVRTRTLLTHNVLAARVVAELESAQRPVLRPVINATGVIVNTNLGRSPLAQEALDAMLAAAQGYTNLEYDLEAGARGSRQAPVRELLCALTGAEDALAVNNNAAAVLVTLAALAAGREVIVSRGELVEIGGGFRVPDVMRQSGARLVEVGTTNRTRLTDYEAAITPETAALLAVHPSNFRVVGFTEAPELAGLAALAHAHDLPLLHDLGSGALEDTAACGLAHEPTPQESITAGSDVVCFSGDKLLGGPQAGLIAGRREQLARIAKHPLMRAVRMDKLTLAALEATLRLHRDGRATAAIPVWQAIALLQEAIRARA
ncbi:MAG TPA: L-seryl-tRNA(Sec) selenium transferase, partial [Ktedonobacterales bacterium]|nr:L-seryl-tRNA(Sec) selenium transferase [Ktedonobacterales bacterium]